MNKFLKFCKEKYLMISYIIISFFLLLACFFEPCAYMVVVACVLFALFFKVENILKIILFTFPFQLALLTTQKIGLFNVLLLILTFIIGIKYILELFKKQKKINLKILIPIIIFLIYIALPFNKFSLTRFGNFVVVFALIYLVYEYRKEVSFKNLVMAFYFGAIVSCVFYLTSFFSTRLNNLINYTYPFENCNYVRFAGLFTHPNNLCVYFLVLLCSICVLQYLNQIKLWQFIIMFVSVFIPTYLAISRNFILSFVLLIIIFSIFFIIKYKKKSFVTLGLLFLSLLFSAVLCFYPTKIYLVRFNILPRSAIAYETVFPKNDKDNIIPDDNTDMPEYNSDKWWDMVYSGEIKYDPGRTGIWKMYLNNWKSSPKNILLGRGISASRIGQMSAHNMFIQLVWEFGLLGNALLLIIIISIVINIKNIKTKLVKILLLTMPVLITLLFESIIVSSSIVWLLLIIVQKNNDNDEIKKIKE